MARGTFAHPRLKNALSKKIGPYTVHFPSGVPTTICDASQRYDEEGVKSIVVAGDNFGRGAARDWATKGPYLLGVRAVLATSFNPTFRANLVKIGILPLKIEKSFYAEIKGQEEFDIELPEDHTTLTSKSTIDIVVRDVKSCVTVRQAEVELENAYEVKLFLDGGIICQMAKS
jgi:aconitate hydratase